MRVSAKKANATTTDVVLEIRMTEDEARNTANSGKVALELMLPKAAIADVLKEHLKSRFRASRVVGQ